MTCQGWVAWERNLRNSWGREGGPGRSHLQERELTPRGRCAARSPSRWRWEPACTTARLPRGGAAATVAPDGGLGRQQRGGERRAPLATDCKARRFRGRRRRCLGVGDPASEPAPDTPASRGRIRDPNKGGRRIKGGGAGSFGLRAGDRIAHPAVRGLCAPERDGEPRPPAAPKSSSRRLPLPSRPLRCPRLSPLSSARRGECAAAGRHRGVGWGRLCCEERGRSSAPPRPRPARGGVRSSPAPRPARDAGLGTHRPGRTRGLSPAAVLQLRTNSQRTRAASVPRGPV